jgi:hypothetical protein
MMAIFKNSHRLFFPSADLRHQIDLRSPDLDYNPLRPSWWTNVRSSLRDSYSTRYDAMSAFPDDQVPDNYGYSYEISLWTIYHAANPLWLLSLRTALCQHSWPWN